MDQIIFADPKGAPGDKAKEAADTNHTGLPGPSDVSPQPLAAGAPKPQLAAELVAQQLGVSRRDRNVRFVRVKQNDSLDLVVRRWCGARDPFLAEAKSLNEDLTVLHVGQEVAVPWVEDEDVLAAVDASKPKVLTAQDGTPAANDVGRLADASASKDKEAVSFAQPGKHGSSDPKSSDPKSGDAKKPATSPAVAAGTSYTVKDGDSLWKIAERTYGKKNATQMVEAMKRANQGLTDKVHVGQKITLPPAPAGA
jgi:LysM repeat protein